MRHALLDRWSRGSSVFHRRDPRAKIAALLVFLIVLATAYRGLAPLAAALFILICGAALWARIPAAGLILRAALVLPFVGTFAVLTWLAGDPDRSLALLLKGYVSALAVLFVVATTPLPLLLRGLESAGVPGFLLMVAQFLYRYLFVISEEARHMRNAAAARGSAGYLPRFRAAAGAVAVLFARSYARAEEIHRAMLARGFTGRIRTLSTLRFGAGDALFAAVACVIPLLIRFAVERTA